MSRAAWEEGCFDPLSLGRTPSCAPLQLGWLASFPGLCLKWPSSCLGLPEPAKGQNQVRGQVQVQVSFGAANRIESDREWIRQDRRDPFSTLYPCDLIGSLRWLLGDFVTGYFNGTRWEPSIYSSSLGEKQVKHMCCTEYTMGVLAAMTKKEAPVVSGTAAWSEKCA